MYALCSGVVFGSLGLGQAAIDFVFPSLKLLVAEPSQFGLRIFLCHREHLQQTMCIVHLSKANTGGLLFSLVHFLYLSSSFPLGAQDGADCRFAVGRSQKFA